MKHISFSNYTNKPKEEVEDMKVMQLRVQFTSTQVGTEDTDEKCKKTCVNMLVYPPGHAYPNTTTMKMESKVGKPQNGLEIELTHQYIQCTCTKLYQARSYTKLNFVLVFLFPQYHCANRFTPDVTQVNDWH